MKKCYISIIVVMLLAPKLHSEDELGSILDAAEFKKIEPTPQITATQSGGNEAKPQASVAPEVDLNPITLPEIVASVNGDIITREQLEEIFKASQEASGAKAADLTNEQKLGAYNQLLQELIMDKLVSVAASGEKVSDADTDMEVAKVKKQFPNENAFAEQLKQAGQTPEKLKENLRTMLQ